jgi:hypothetical protein
MTKYVVTAIILLPTQRYSTSVMLSACMYVLVCENACMRACVRARVCVCVATFSLLLLGLSKYRLNHMQLACYFYLLTIELVLLYRI